MDSRHDENSAKMRMRRSHISCIVVDHHLGNYVESADVSINLFPTTQTLSFDPSRFFLFITLSLLDCRSSFKGNEFFILYRVTFVRDVERV